MLGKAGNETAGRRRADVRRSIVFRFLAGCAPAEMKIFLDLIFGPFSQFVTGEVAKSLGVFFHLANKVSEREIETYRMLEYERFLLGQNRTVCMFLA